MADGGTAVDPGGSGVAVSGTQQNRGGRRRGPRRGGANNQTPVETTGAEQQPIARGTGRRGRGGQRQNQPNQANDGPAQSQGDTQMENQNPARRSARRGRGGRQAGQNPQAQGQQPVSESESANRDERGRRGNQSRPANRGNRGAGPGRVYIPRPPPLFDEFERGEHGSQQDFTIGPLNPNSSRGRRGSFFQGNWHQGQMVQQRNGPNPFHFDPSAPEFVPGQPMRGPKTPKHNKPRKYPPRERAASPKSRMRRIKINELQQESLDCTICLNKVRKRDRIWSCSTCYNIFHLPCMRTWGNSTETTMWKCPLCQLDCPPNPPYKCFCGKEKNPEFSRGEIPHSCGKPCQKVKGVNCPHLCTEPCHPGPCPECPATVLKPCLCGKKRIPVRCGAKSALRMCALICEKPLPCGMHKCARPCHDGACNDCEQEEEKVCCCGKETKMKLGRMKCDEPVPTCGKTCNKQLFCGSGEHRCQSACHQGPCPPCPLSTSVPCRCGRSRQEVDCVEFNSNFELYSTLECDNICPKKLMCGKHVCQKKCCPLDMHICEKIPCIVYPEFLRDAMRIEGPFVVAVEETFKKLIESVDRLGYEQSHNFPPMHAHRRRIIHEYARLYKICTESVDREPKRSVIATARRKLEKFFEIAAAQPPVPLEPGLQAVGSTKKAFRRQAPQPVFAAPQPTLISNRFAAMALFDDDYGAETRQAQQPPKIDSPSTSTESEAPAEQPAAEPEEDDDPSTWEDL
ncbi:unnamed protein product, partial [Mesorhabditis spiculigera]